MFPPHRAVRRHHESFPAPFHGPPAMGSQPDPSLSQIFRPNLPAVEPTNFSQPQPRPQIQCTQAPQHQQRQAGRNHASPGMTRHPHQKPKRRVGEQTQEVLNRFAHANRSRPPQLMPPGRGPPQPAPPAFHNHRTQLDRTTRPHQSLTKLVVVRQIIRERPEASAPSRHVPGHRHDRPQGKIKRPQIPGLQNLAPEIGIGHERFPARSTAASRLQPIQAGPHHRRGEIQPRRELLQQIRRSPYVRVATTQKG